MSRADSAFKKAYRPAIGFPVTCMCEMHLQGLDTRCNIARNKLQKWTHGAILRNIARNVASCVRSFSQGLKMDKICSFQYRIHSP